MPSREISDFGDVMTSRLREFDDLYGTNGYIDNDFGSLLDSFTRTARMAREDIIMGDNVSAKTRMVDIANLAMILWSKL